MGSSDHKQPVTGSSGRAHTARPDEPQWTAGLKRLYDSVVEEPLPDSFRDLLSKLDSGEGK
ncbi:NepR family anti-sigma factor [Erythrobacter sp. EC-HK427]|uniref:NepR family anti-sigma factor n=1 Tax=Erythrobacter sp. EC-HK427 TaxID=2038396 RepID=UPI0012598A3D|nr:NepR family anti-sigma factor [Erythrobacter sp. EC-HK427]VVS99082.1 conserved hypothetical protein [Erythrobacter sp. EC-HK427]